MSNDGPARGGFAIFPEDWICFIYDVAGSLPNYRFDVLFDVGANVGQSAIAYRKAFPNAAIYGFEPIGASFQ